MIRRFLRPMAACFLWTPIVSSCIAIIFAPLFVSHLTKFEVLLGKFWSIVGLPLVLIIVLMVLSKIFDLNNIIGILVTGEAVTTLIVGFFAFVSVPSIAKDLSLLATGLFIFSFFAGVLTLAFDKQYSELFIRRGLALISTIYFFYGLLVIVWIIIKLLL